MSLHNAIIRAVSKGTEKWAKQRKAEERHASALANRRKRLVRASDYYNFKSAAHEVMEQAYLAASANGTLPASARQVMYQARPFIQDKMGGQQLNDQYFCQQLLPNYMEERGVDWDIVYDDRGHFAEPHTERTFGLGTIAVRSYLFSIGEPKWAKPSADIGGCITCGPKDRFGAVLFIEKEGFIPLFERVRLAKRYDIAIMSTKGVSVTACRKLVDNLSSKNIPLLALHDFDKAGFSILSTLRRDTRRYSFSSKPNVIDLGLRLDDVHALGLQAEKAFDKGTADARRRNLRTNGATAVEIEFLLHQRVELNAMTSDQLVAWIERKLKHHGVKKIIPHKEQLAKAYRLFVRNQRIEEIIEKALEDEAYSDIPIPSDLERRVKKYLTNNPAEPWDHAVSIILQRDD